MAEIGDYLEQYTYGYLMAKALSHVPNDIDKRQGSIIFDALSPACMALSESFLSMRQIYKDTYVETATGDYLEMRTSERGITRKQATKAIRLGEFKDASNNPVDIVIGTRFSTIGTPTYTYSVVEATATAGEYLLECEQAGTGGNSYVGDIIPITYIPPLAVATLSDIIVPAEDLESDDELKFRYKAEVGSTPFGGNIADYDQFVNSIDGVGEVQVYPVWNGGGTVMLSVVDSDFNPANPAFISILQDIIDPENGSGSAGTGLGVAPIGHLVMVVAPQEYVVNTTATVTLKGGANLPSAQSEVEAEIGGYINELARGWGVADSNNNYNADVYTAQITSAILRSASVANATNVKTNGTAADKLLLQTPSTQQIPKMGTVVLSVS